MSYAYRVPNRSTVVNFLGRFEFSQCSAHRPTKNAYGLDVMQIDFRGAVFNLAKFLATLSQGKRYDHEGRVWYLQTWEVDDNNLWPTVSLNCIGFATGKTPEPKPDNSFVNQTVTITGQVTEIDPLTSDPVIVSLTRTMSFRCMQTSWSYINEGQIKGPRIGRTEFVWNPLVLSSVITANSTLGNFTYSGANAPATYVTATFPAIVDFILDLSQSKVFGTPFYEVNEVIVRTFYAV